MMNTNNDVQLHLEFLKYEAARQTGKFNMVMDAQEVMKRYHISKENYIRILQNYSELHKKYLLN